jgi:hypothetical protein
MQAYFVISSCVFRNKILVLVIVKKIRDLEKFIPDPGGKNAPDTGSAALYRKDCIY